MLEAVLARAGYGSPMEALAAMAIFVHGDVVAAMQGRPMFRTIRNPALRGQVIMRDGDAVFCDDNHTPRVAFTLASGVNAFAPDMVTNHLYDSGRNWRHYTHPANLVLTPEFLAKLTDGKGPCAEALRYRAWEISCYCGPDGVPPAKPPSYPTTWQSPQGSSATLVDRCWDYVWSGQGKKGQPNQRRDRATCSVAELGWGWSIGPDPRRRGALG